MDNQQILYVSLPPPTWPDGSVYGLESTFSPYVSNYISPPTVQTYVNTLCEKMNRIIRSPGAPANPVASPVTPTVAAQPPSAPISSPVPSAPPPQAATPPAPVTASTAVPPSSLHSKQPAPKPKSQESLHKPALPEPKPQTSASTFAPAPAPAPTPNPTPSPASTVTPKKQISPTSKPRQGTLKEMHVGTSGKKTEQKVPSITDSPKCLPLVGSASLPPIPELLADPAQLSGSNVIGQIKPEVLSTLVEIMQMNAVKFYMQRGDQEENQLCTEIKVHILCIDSSSCIICSWLFVQLDFTRFITGVFGEPRQH